MKPTVQEVIDALRENFRPYYKDHMLVTESELAERIRANGISPPDGFVLVPIEPAAEMLASCTMAVDKRLAIGIYKEMLAAAPKENSNE